MRDRRRSAYDGSCQDPFRQLCLKGGLEFGRGQIILRDDDGTLCGATEPRTDGTVAVW